MTTKNVRFCPVFFDKKFLSKINGPIFGFGVEQKRTFFVTIFSYKKGGIYAEIFNIDN